MASGAIPTPSGNIQCLVKKVSGSVEIDATLPSGVQEAKVGMKGVSLHVVEGPKAISGDGTATLVLGPGHYKLHS